MTLMMDLTGSIFTKQIRGWLHSFLRKSRNGDVVVFVVNATSMVRYNYWLGVPESGFYREIINT